MTQRLQNVVGVFPVGVSGWAVVADGERHGFAGIDVAQAIAHDGGTANLLGVLPDNLGEVTPAVKELHERGGKTVEGSEEAHLVVVHQVGDHLTDAVRRDTVADVLAVATSVDAPIKALLVFFFFYHHLVNL